MTLKIKLFPSTTLGHVSYLSLIPKKSDSGDMGGLAIHAKHVWGNNGVATLVVQPQEVCNTNSETQAT